MEQKQKPHDRSNWVNELFSSKIFNIHSTEYYIVSTTHSITQLDELRKHNVFILYFDWIKLFIMLKI